MHRRSYIYGIDLLRFTAAVMVALFHLTWFEASTAQIDWFGWIGVQIFFVISGFVIAQSAQDAGPVSFAISRFLRLYPAAWICGAISLAILLYNGSTAPTLLPLLSEFFRSVVLYPMGPFIATAYWTLPIEITFYALIGFVLYLRAFDDIETIALGLCLCSGAYLCALALLYLGIIHTPWLDFGYGWKNITLLRHGIYFSAGIFCWLISEKRLGWRGAIGLLVVCLCAPMEITCRTDELTKLMPRVMDVRSIGWVPVLIWFLALAFILASAHWREQCQHLPRPVLRTVRLLGLTTYPFYLMHERIGRAVRHIFLSKGYSSALAIAIGGLIVTAVVAILVARYGEPLLRKVMAAWISRLRRRQKRLA
ncbi:acyltransferase [Acidisoma cellulosilytica]|uniref:Acyltransferase n=1 Tax=Acidisoma cellulosilyticum TaxID=2802395 RepID=A0A963Z4D8_9PROT|nr:acyltransferase [Acidisoma cellulosilyticum]MCB8882414.1 acyltransferase [Acidisoma cellulosilyticum]